MKESDSDGSRADAVVGAEWEPVERDREHVEEQEADEEDGKRGDDEQHRREDARRACRRDAMRPATPTSVPMANAMTVVTPTSPSVQGSLLMISVSTGIALRGEPELTGEAVPDVLQVGDQDVLVDVDAELDLQGVQGRRVDVAERGQHRLSPHCPA